MEKKHTWNCIHNIEMNFLNDHNNGPYPEQIHTQLLLM